MAGATVLYQERELRVDDAIVEGDDLWLPLAALTGATGWELKPEGVCKEEVCVPVPAQRRAVLLRDASEGTVLNITEFARLIEQPFAHDANNAVWYFGPAGWEWRTRLSSEQAPDFTLPDLAGKEHSLSELLGKKVFLLFWASW